MSTPIGNARDITLRCLDALTAADAIAAEDTRSMRKLLEIHGIPLGGRPLMAYHEHTSARDRSRIIKLVREGNSVVYASEAGTPMIADPGFRLVQEAQAEGIPVSALPGPSAVLPALALSGLPSDRFTFAGFAPTSKSARQRFLREVSDASGTLVFYESPRRVRAFLNDACTIFGNDREAAAVREITKKFEEVKRGTLATIYEAFLDAEPKGEFVILVGPAPKTTISDEELISELELALQSQTVRDAVSGVAKESGAPRSRIYKLALTLDRSP